MNLALTFVIVCRCGQVVDGIKATDAWDLFFAHVGVCKAQTRYGLVTGRCWWSGWAIKEVR